MDEITGQKITKDLNALLTLARAMGYYDIIVSVGLPPKNGEEAECGAISFCRNKFIGVFSKEYVQKHPAIAADSKEQSRRNLEATVFNYGNAFKS